MRLSLAILALLVTPAGAQQAFVPFTIDAAKYAEIDATMAKQNMPREAHAAWITLWDGIEKQAQIEARRAPAPPPKDDAAK